jgi:hypothetical protein
LQQIKLAAQALELTVEELKQNSWLLELLRID